MLTLQKALLTHLSPLALPVYLADCVPERTPFPYVTMALNCGGGFPADGDVTLTLWCRGAEANLQRASLAASLQALFPDGGTVLTLENGAAALYPAEANALAHAASQDARGLRFRLALRLYAVNVPQGGADTP